MGCRDLGSALQAALILDGVGTDNTWRQIGGVVEKAAKQHGRWLTNVFNSLMPRVSNIAKIDPLIMRNDIRDAVIADFRQLQAAGVFKNDDPFRGLAGTKYLPWRRPSLK